MGHDAGSEEEWSSLDDNEQCKLVYANAGLALYLAQCFEMVLANFLLVAGRLDGEHLTQSEFEKVELSLQQETLGRLIRKVKQRATVDENAAYIIQHALDQRNTLVHGFFRDRAELWFAERGRRKILDELLDMQSVFKRADAVGSALAGVAARALGISDEAIEREFHALMERHSE